MEKEEKVCEISTFKSFTQNFVLETKNSSSRLNFFKDRRRNFQKDEIISNLHRPIVPSRCDGDESCGFCRELQS